MFNKNLFLGHITNTSKRTLSEQGFLQGPIRNKSFVDMDLKLARKQEEKIRSQGFDSPEAYQSRKPEIKIEYGPEAKEVDIQHTPGSHDNHIHQSSPGFVVPEGYAYMGSHEMDRGGRLMKDSIKLTVDVWRHHGFGSKPELSREIHHIAPESSVKNMMSDFDPRGESGSGGRNRDPDKYLRAIHQRYQAGLIPPGDGTGM